MTTGQPPGVPVFIHATDPYAELTRRSSWVGLSIDGGPRRALRFGTSRIVLPPGRHQLHFTFPLKPDGGARLAIDTTGGAPVQVYYAAAFNAFSPGTVGFQPDRQAAHTRSWIRNMNKWLWVALAVCFGLIGLIVLGLLVWIVYLMATLPF